jgi:hypothetical protein
MTTEKQVEDWHCMCGMALQHPSEYHPYAACLMFQACRNGDEVRANLMAVMQYGKESL